MFADLGPTPLLTIGGGVAITIGGLAKTLAAFGVLAFGVAAVAALIFRFAATEGARYYIEGLRFPEDPVWHDNPRAEKSLKKRRKKIGDAQWSKPLAGIMLGLGGVLVAVSLALLLLTDDIPKQINELAKLHTSGVITDNEFEEKKSQLLARL